MKSEWKDETEAMKQAPKVCGRRKNEDGYVEPNLCRTMQNALGDTLANERKKGFVPLYVTNTETFKQRLVGVAYHKSARDTGLMLKHCPFCGNGILQEAREENLVSTLS